MFAQLPPLLSHRLHWYEYVIGVVPVHVPLVVVSVDPSVVVPEIVGGAVFLGVSLAEAWLFVAAPKTAPIASAVRASPAIRASVRPLEIHFMLIPPGLLGFG